VTDQITPNLITVDAQGRVGADFTGHVHAAGIDIDAGTVVTPPAESRVRWIQKANGVVAADAYGLSAFGLDGQIFVRCYSNGDVAFAALEAQDYNLDPLGYGARLQVQSFPGGAVPKRHVAAVIEPEVGGDPLVSSVFLDSLGRGSPTVKTDDPWHTLTAGYVAGWTDWDANLFGHQPAYRKTAGNRVQLRGLVKAPAAGAPAFTVFYTLPAGYRPGGEQLWAGVGNDTFAPMGIQGVAGGIYCRRALAALEWCTIAYSFYAEF
jgi:hypothetical protein